MTVGKRIQEARKKAGMKQSDLAEKLGVAVITIGQYERGKRQPSLEQIRHIADALNADVVYLISGQTTAEVQNGILIQSKTEARAELEKRRKQKESPHSDDELRGYIDQWRECYEDEKKLSDEMIDHASSFDFDAVPRQDLEELLADTDLVISKYSQVIAGLEQIKREKPEVIEKFPDLDKDLDRMRNTRNLFVHIRDNELFESLNKLNQLGREKVKERIEELSEIPRYRAETAPQSTQAPQEGNDTTPPQDAPETPPEGK